MLVYVKKGAKRLSNADSLQVPEDLARRLSPWIDVREVSIEGLWLWLGSMLHLLPSPVDPTPGAEPRDRVRELARDLVYCGRERARLTVMCDRYYHDNAVLARRVKALEASLRTLKLAGVEATTPIDHEGAGEFADRYLPR